MTNFEISKKIKKLLDTLEKTRKSISKVQSECPHEKRVFTYGANTGNYDPSNDSYWKDYFCPTCEKRWRIYLK